MAPSDRHGLPAGFFGLPIPVPAKTHTRHIGTGLSGGFGVGHWRVDRYMTRRGYAAGRSHFYINIHNTFTLIINTGERMCSPTPCCPLWLLLIPLPKRLASFWWMTRLRRGCHGGGWLEVVVEEVGR